MYKHVPVHHPKKACEGTLVTSENKSNSATVCSHFLKMLDQWGWFWCLSSEETQLEIEGVLHEQIFLVGFQCEFDFELVS